MTEDRVAAASETLLFDPRSDEFRRDPAACYRRLRETAPVYRNPLGGWLLSRHGDCSRALEDTRLRNVENIRCYPDSAAGSQSEAAPSPDDFSRIRKSVTRVLAPAAVRGFEPRIQQIVSELLDSALKAGEVDLVEAFCAPLAAIVFCELFGVPAADRAVFGEWVEAVVQGADMLLIDSPEVARRHGQALADFSAYFRKLIADRRRRPGDNLLDALIAIQRDSDSMTEQELVSSCVILLITGHESTVNFVANATHALLGHPGELMRFRDDPAVRGAAIEELMRYASPATLVVRAAQEDLEVDGHRIAGGELVVLLLGAANRDPAIFADPDRLILTRKPNPHLAFGHGLHFCLGAALARLEGWIALEALLRRAPAIELLGEPEPKPTIALRGLAQLPVRLR